MIGAAAIGAAALGALAFGAAGQAGGGDLNASAAAVLAGAVPDGSGALTQFGVTAAAPAPPGAALGGSLIFRATASGIVAALESAGAAALTVTAPAAAGVPATILTGAVSLKMSAQAHAVAAALTAAASGGQGLFGMTDALAVAADANAALVLTADGAADGAVRPPIGGAAAGLRQNVNSAIVSNTAAAEVAGVAIMSLDAVAAATAAALVAAANGFVDIGILPGGTGFSITSREGKLTVIGRGGRLNAGRPRGRTLKGGPRCH